VSLETDAPPPAGAYWVGRVNPGRAGFLRVAWLLSAKATAVAPDPAPESRALSWRGVEQDGDPDSSPAPNEELHLSRRFAPRR
jgi:hypothetical protein